MYESDWFSKETMTKEEVINNNDKKRISFQKFFMDEDIVKKQYNDTKG